MSNSNPLVVQLFFRTLAMELRTNRKILASTLASYLSHMSTLLTEQGWPFAHCVHSTLLTRLMSGWKREDILNHPARLTAQIPATCAVMAHFLQVAARLYAGNPIMILEVQSCGALMYYAALRAAEGPAASVSARDDVTSHHIRADSVYVRFPGHPSTFHPVVRGSVFPQGQKPSSFDFFQDHSKNMVRGAGQISIHPNPNPEKKPFCAVALLWRYVTTCPPPPGGAFFPNILSGHITTVMHATATDLSLDPSRMSARAIRPGSASMIRSLKSNLVQQSELDSIAAHGRWLCDMSGTYSHDCADSRQRLIAPSLYNDSFMSIKYLVWYYMTPIAR